MQPISHESQQPTYCLLCRGSSRENMLKCSCCRDRYHAKCLLLEDRLSIIQEQGHWQCPGCTPIVLKNLEQQIYKQKEDICRICRKAVQQKARKCERCSESYHDVCYNPTQSQHHLCQDCMDYMRNYMVDFMVERFSTYIRLTIRLIAQHNLLPVEDGNLHQKILTPRARSFNLRCFKHYSEHKDHYRYSLVEALMVKGQRLWDQQLYRNKEDMELNRSWSHGKAVLRLHQKDEKAYQKFIKQIRGGKCPPIEITRHPQKGYIVSALKDIPKNTILSQVGGEVLTERATRARENDCTITLLATNNSHTTLNVSPQTFANISKFYSGVNNQNPLSQQLVNLRQMLFSYRGRAQIIYASCRAISAGEELVIDYNAGGGNRFPTSHFQQ